MTKGTLGVETFEGHHEQERERPSRAELTRSDAELTTFYTSSLGVRAQGYESSGIASSVSDFDRAIVRELDDADLNGRPTRLSMHDAVMATLALIPYEVRIVLDRVYIPCGTGFVPSRKQAEENRNGKPKGEEIAPDFLSIALAPRWGGGSFVRLALTQPRTLAQFEKQHPDKVGDPASLLAFLSAEAGKGNDAAPFFRRLREDCEAPRTRALEAYDVHRVERCRRDAAEARRRKDAAATASAALFEATLEAKSHRARARLQRLRDLDAIELASEIYADVGTP